MAASVQARGKAVVEKTPPAAAADVKQTNAEVTFTPRYQSKTG